MAIEEVCRLKTSHIYCFLLFLVCCYGQQHPSCQIWKRMAHNLSSQPRKQMTCFSNDTDTCTSLRCTGTYKYTSWLLPSSNGIEVDYCFGMRLNHCMDPVSMDIYLIVPSADNAPQNISYQKRISHDTQIQIPGFSFHVRNLGDVDVFLHFHMVRNGSVVDFAITVKVRVTSSLGNLVMWPKKMQKEIVPMEKIPVPPCTNHTDTTTPPPMAVIGGCHPPTWHPPTNPPGVSTTTKSPFVTALPKSATYNMSCDEGDQSVCGELEMCDLSVKRCVCNPDFKYDVTQGTCEGRNRLDKPCSADAVCYDGEMCSAGKCVCKIDFVFVRARQMCLPKSAVVDTTTPHIPTRPPVTLPHTHVVAASSDNKTAVIAGAVVGGIVLIVLVGLVAFFLVKRMRRPYDHREMLLSDDTDGIM